MTLQKFVIVLLRYENIYIFSFYTLISVVRLLIGGGINIKLIFFQIKWQITTEEKRINQDVIIVSEP